MNLWDQRESKACKEDENSTYADEYKLNSDLLCLVNKVFSAL